MSSGKGGSVPADDFEFFAPSDPEPSAAERAGELPAAPRQRRGNRRPPRHSGQLLNRVLVAIPAVIYALFIISEGGLVFALGLVPLGALALHELYAMLYAVRPNRLGGLVVLLGLMGAALYGDQFHILLAAICAFPAVFLLEMLLERSEHITLGIAGTIFGAFWIGLPFAHAILLRDLPHGSGIIIDILVGTFVGDTFAYLGGRMFGRHTLAPRISPNKTQEGLFAGLIGAAAAVWFAGLYEDWLSGTNALLLGFAVAAAAPIGDLFESLVKRDFEVKDSGKFFGAHGGALDRLDAVLFTIPVGYYVWYAMAA